MLRVPFFVAEAALLFAIAANAGPTLKGAPQYHLTQGSVPTAETTAAIAKADAELFRAVFALCDPGRVAGMLTDDFRFVHDKDGETSRGQFLTNLKSHCDRVRTGEDFPARRELVPHSLQVSPINHYGALEIGAHRFFAQLPGKPEELTETGNFIILWKKAGDRWLMAESISYGHRLAQ
jgi:hypothetical protein